MTRWKNMQEPFDYVVDKLFVQGRMSARYNRDGGHVCLYRGPDNDRCGMGWLIDDEHYIPEFEGQPIHDIYAETGLPDTREWRAFARDVQEVHDEKTNWGQPSYLADAFRAMAQRHCLLENQITESLRHANWSARR